jgi:hypothetical protein
MAGAMCVATAFGVNTTECLLLTSYFPVTPIRSAAPHRAEIVTLRW